MCHVKQQTKKPVYVLTQYVKGVTNFVTWIEENSSMIEPLWAQDVLNLSSSW